VGDSVQNGLINNQGWDDLKYAFKIKKNCHQYYEVGVQEVTEDDLNDRTKLYFQFYKFDLKYSGINVDYVLHSFMQNDTKADDGKLDSWLERLRVEFNWAISKTDSEAHPTRARQNQAVQRGAPSSMFSYGGQFYSVPKTFSFPKARLQEATRFWLKGQTMSSDGQERVRPFMKLMLAMLSRNLNATFRTQWLPILKFLEEKLATQSKETFEDDEDETEQKYRRCLAHLKDQVSDCWNKTKSDPTKFTLGTWSNKTKRLSAIVKSGNAMDREKLSEASNHSKVRPNKRRIKKKAEKPLYPSCQRRRIEKQQGRTHRDNQSNNDDGEDAFVHMLLEMCRNGQI
jgi:hypothetical protein